MAQYLKIDRVHSDPALQGRVRFACVVAADAIQSDLTPPPNQAARLVWAAKVLEDPVTEGRRMLWEVLVKRKGILLINIKALSDNQIQSSVDACVDLIANNPL